MNDRYRDHLDFQCYVKLKMYVDFMLVDRKYRFHDQITIDSGKTESNDKSTYFFKRRWFGYLISIQLIAFQCVYVTSA